MHGKLTKTKLHATAARLLPISHVDQIKLAQLSQHQSGVCNMDVLFARSGIDTLNSLPNANKYPNRAMLVSMKRRLSVGTFREK